MTKSGYLKKKVKRDTNYQIAITQTFLDTREVSTYLLFKKKRNLTFKYPLKKKRHPRWYFWKLCLTEKKGENIPLQQKTFNLKPNNVPKHAVISMTIEHLMQQLHETLFCLLKTPTYGKIWLPKKRGINKNPQRLTWGSRSISFNKPTPPKKNNFFSKEGTQTISFDFGPLKFS